ncbi:MAG: PAS domain S-box protein [Proteobacteria bacterium]|nr:PAS domain S-box protein [Pseudomonadota bacterium]
MKKNKSVSGKVHAHREEAEQRLAAKGTAAEQRTDVDARLAIHELQVHQIELEMQNEELRRVQAELEGSRSRYSDLYDFAPVGYFTFDQRGLILEVNLTGTTLLGVERSALSKRPFVLFIAPEHQDAFYLHLRQVMQTGTQQTCEIRLIRKDGTWFHAQLASIAVDDGEQNTSHCRTVVIDITERKQAEAEAQSLARFPEENPHPVMRVTGEGGVLYANRPAGDILTAFGCAAAGPLPEALLQGVRQVIAEGQTCEREITVPAGRVFSFIIASSRGVEHINLYGRDITEHKLVEDAQSFLLQCGFNENFFESLARYLAEKLHMHYVCIDQLHGDCLIAKTLAIYCDGKFEDNVEYTLKDTPCGDVVGKTICSFPKDVCRLFPRDVVLQEMHAESYVGTTLWSSRGKPIGLIAVIGLQQLPNPGLAESLLKLVAVRAAGELERRQAGEALRRAKDELELRVQERTAELAHANELLLEEIQEHKRKKEALQAAALYARTLLEANLDPLVTISREGKIMDANLAAEQAIGLSRELIIGSDFSDCFTEPIKARTGYEQVFKQGFVRDYPLAIKSPSGMVMDVLYNATVFKNSAGEVEGVLASARDISVRKRIERDLSQSELRLKDAQKIAHLGSWEWEVNSDEQRWSEELYRIFGYDPHKMAMTHEISFNAIHPEDQDYVTRMVWEALETNDDYNIDFRVIRADGAMRFLNSQARLYRDNQGRPQRMVGSVLDITDRKNIERELQESEQQLRRLTAELLIAQEAERKRIAGEVHDELGQSLTVLKLRLRTIEKQLLKDQIKIKGECLDLLGYADGILKSVRRISRDLTPSILEDLGLSAAVRWLVDNFKENLDVNIALQADNIDSLVPKELQINVYRILQECLSNIGKHAGAQNITVSIRELQDGIRLCVEDDGEGYDVEQLAFLDGSKKGVGISTMRERALILNGTLDISSRQGAGTCVTLRIPRGKGGAI